MALPIIPILAVGGAVGSVFGISLFGFKAGEGLGDGFRLAGIGAAVAAVVWAIQGGHVKVPGVT